MYDFYMTRDENACIIMIEKEYSKTTARNIYHLEW